MKNISRMKIAGLQKVTTIDYPGKIACTIFLHGCDFRCGFCYNPDLVIKEGAENFSVESILKFLEKRKGKLDAVCITGGEPLMSLDFDFVKKIKELGYKVKIDTNGSFPGRLKEMIDLGLVDYVAMDVKSCRKDYSKVAGVVVDLKKIEESIKIVDEFGGEFRTTVVSRYHDIDSLKDLGKWLNKICGAKPKRYFLQGFKRNKGGMIDSSFLEEKNVDEKFLNELKNSVEEFFEEVEVRI
ncbi:MAG: anaerobic ribonucleoside-triphosphate reductase activating protein [archaeon]